MLEKTLFDEIDSSGIALFITVAAVYFLIPCDDRGTHVFLVMISASIHPLVPIPSFPIRTPFFSDVFEAGNGGHMQLKFLKPVEETVHDGEQTVLTAPTSVVASPDILRKRLVGGGRGEVPISYGDTCRIGAKKIR